MSNDNNDHGPDAAPLEALLLQQAHELNEIFHEYLERAVIGRFSKDLIHVALRAQAQCQTTARTLQLWQQKDGKESDKS